uniref:RNA helicase n=1 Tax=Physcomitrium patens TaxID=3218 RepID=A0A7I4FRQ7_PHYPA
MGRDKYRDREKDYGDKEHWERERDKERKHREREKRGDRDLEKERDERKRSRRDDDGVEVKDKEKERDRKGGERDREGKKERDREREREREAEEERDRKRRKKDEDESREREEIREKEEREREREKERLREREKERDREEEREKSREREREREKSRDRDKDKEKEKDREKGRDKHRERTRDKDRDRERDLRSGEGDRDRDRKRRRKEEDAARDDLKVKKDPENDEDPEEEQKRLDEEIDKRRRRVQEWQELRRRKDEEDRQKRESVQADADVVSSPKNAKKTWTLEGEDSDDEEDAVLPKSGGTTASRVAAFDNGDLVMADFGGNGSGDPAAKFVKLKPKREDSEEEIAAPIQTVKVKQEVEEEEEIDPLDAFMNSITIPEVSSTDAVELDAPESKPIVAKSGSGKGQDNVKPVKRNNRNTLGRIMPGDDSASEDEDDGEGKEGDEDDDEFLKRVKKTKAEKLAIVDHSKIQYPSFRKNFYIEVKEISRMTKAEAEAYRKELELKIRGKDVPRPLKTWNQTGLNSKVLDVIKKSGFEKPMPIQTQALPIIMSGRDCIGIAKTGSGKTLAFVLPMLRHIMDQPPLQQGDGPIGLIMAPTRELVQQIYNDIRKFSKVVGLTCVPVYGGSGVAQQISDLKRGTEIVVCTPGRMIDILCTSSGKITNLRRVTYLVMDEADRMFDMGFEPQITRIVQNTRPDRQTVLFSATFPRQVEVLARKVLTKPVEIQIGGRSVVNSDITQTVEVRPESERFLRLLELLGEWYEKGKILVFVHSQEKCDSLFKDLLKAGYPCLSLHGAKDQTDRESTITDFKTSVCNLMIATSIAARGLDVKELELVVNYDVPNHYEDYVHRVGRTGRAGRKGFAVTFISTEEERWRNVIGGQHARSSPSRSCESWSTRTNESGISCQPTVTSSFSKYGSSCRSQSSSCCSSGSGSSWSACNALP